MTHYIVIGSQGDYECNHTWNEKLFADKEKAEEYVKTKNEEILKKEAKHEICRLCPILSMKDPEDFSEEDISEINSVCDVNTNPNSEYKDKTHYCKTATDWNVFDTTYPVEIKEIELSE